LNKKYQEQEPLGKNQEQEPEPLGKKLRVGTAKKVSGSPALGEIIFLCNTYHFL